MLSIEEQAQHFAALARQRRSVRGFLPDPVEPELLRHIFDLAQSAPSNCNTQPWIVHVVSGHAAEAMRSALHDRALRDAEPSPDFPITGTYQGAYRERQIGAAKALFSAQGITRDDMDGRRRSALRNFRFFDAPHAAFIFIPAQFGMREAADCGMYAQTLMLALTAHGLASCAQGALSFYADVVRSQLGVPGDHHLLFGIALGYEDTAHPANTARTDRASQHDAAIFHG